MLNSFRESFSHHYSMLATAGTISFCYFDITRKLNSEPMQAIKFMELRKIVQTIYGQFQRYSRYIFSIFLFSLGHKPTIKHLVDQSNKFKAYDDLGVQLYINT